MLRPAPVGTDASGTPTTAGVRRSAVLREQVAVRAALLEAGERLLLEQVYLHGWTAKRVACLSGCSARQVRRRVRRLTRLVLAPGFAAVAVRSGEWSDEMREVGRAVFIRGLSRRAAASELGLPYIRVLQHARAVEALAGRSVRSGKRGAA